MARIQFSALAVAILLASPAGAQRASFRGLGELPGGGFRSEARAISADGRYVVGSSANAAAEEQAFIWSVESGLSSLGSLPGVTASVAEGVSADGTKVAGYITGPGSYRPFRWTTSGGMQVLEPGAEIAFAWGISDDGASIVGGYGSSTVFGGNQEAYRWTPSAQYEFLGYFPQGASTSVAWDTSADGAVVTGTALSGAGQQEAFRWTAADGMIGLGDLPGGEVASWAFGVSADGRVVVGESSPGFGREAFRWSAETGMIGLGHLPGNDDISTAYATSADGSIVVGTSVTQGRSAAFLWDQAHGMRSLQSVLETEHGLDLGGWQLVTAADISADGLSIAGTGTNPAGQIEAWVATIPEPSSVILAIIPPILAILLHWIARLHRGACTSTGLPSAAEM
jgi:probable HAF family extracellular repeat protein